MYRVGRCLPRSRVCLLSFDGGARVCPGGVSEAQALTMLWNNVWWPLLCLDGILIGCPQQGRRVTSRRPGKALHHLRQVMSLASFSFGYRNVCGFCGWCLAGSGSIFSRRRWSSVASLDLGARGVGLQPWSMGDYRWLQPTFHDGCQIWLGSKPVCYGTLPAHGGVCLLRQWRWPAMRRLTTGGSWRF